MNDQSTVSPLDETLEGSSANPTPQQTQSPQTPPLDEATITAQVEQRLRRQLAELTEIAGQAKRLGVTVDPAQALARGVAPDALRREHGRIVGEILALPAVPQPVVHAVTTGAVLVPVAAVVVPQPTAVFYWLPEPPLSEVAKLPVCLGLQPVPGTMLQMLVGQPTTMQSGDVFDIDDSDADLAIGIVAKADVAAGAFPAVGSGLLCAADNELAVTDKLDTAADSGMLPEARILELTFPDKFLENSFEVQTRDLGLSDSVSTIGNKELVPVFDNTSTSMSSSSFISRPLCQIASSQLVTSSTNFVLESATVLPATCALEQHDPLSTANHPTNMGREDPREGEGNHCDLTVIESELDIPFSDLEQDLISGRDLHAMPDILETAIPENFVNASSSETPDQKKRRRRKKKKNDPLTCAALDHEHSRSCERVLGGGANESPESTKTAQDPDNVGG